MVEGQTLLPGRNDTMKSVRLCVLIEDGVEEDEELEKVRGFSELGKEMEKKEHRKS